MPYSITTKDGITISGVPDDMPADHPDLKARVAEIRARGAPAAPAPPDDPGVAGSIAIGAGRTTDRILDGITQAYLKARGEDQALGGLKTNVDEKSALYKPLQDQHPVATAVGESIPSMVVPVGGAATAAGTVGRLALAGGAPGALEYGDAGERAARAAGGAAAGVVGGVVAPKIAGAVAGAIPAVGRTARAIVEPFFDAGRQRIAGRALNTAAGDAAPAVAGRLDAAAPLVPGSLPTAGQVADSGGIAALERSASARNPEPFAARANDQALARADAVGAVAGDPAKVAAATNARDTTAKQLYQDAFAQNGALSPSQLKAQADLLKSSKITALLQTPAVADARQAALTIAANKGIQMDDAAGSIQGLHFMKLAMDDAVSAAKGKGTASGDNLARSIMEARGRLLNAIETLSPGYKAARTTYAQMSAPINQMEVGQRLYDTLKPALSDSGALGQESAASFARALRNGDATVKQATGRDLGFSDVMSPSQGAALQGVAADLARKANAQNLGRGVGSNTFQNLAMDNIGPAIGPIASAASHLPFGIGTMVKGVYERPEQEIQSLIAQALLDPKNAAALMRAAPSRAPGQPISQRLAANPSLPARVGGGAAGLALGNLFAQ